MHFVGIKCEMCIKLANTNDPIDDLPYGWIALVQKAPILSFSRRKDLHFCSFACLYTWTDRKREQVALENEAQQVEASEG
jgi:hypothetical protein